MIAIIDYGLGNLRSVEKTFGYLGYEAMITADPHQIVRASHVVLPGVGAFRDCIGALRATGMEQSVRETVASGKPLLGICVGMQMLFEGSEENGTYEGLGIMKGVVRRLPGGPGLKIPHMGWNSIEEKASILFEEGASHDVYFVHSYACQTLSDETIAVCTYGVPFVAAVQKDNIVATQFHPEKSGYAGLRMLRRFAQWKGGCAAC